MDTNILSYLNYYQERLEQGLKRNDLEDHVRLDMEIRKRAIDDLTEKISFLEKSKVDKQAIRIEWLASWIKRNKDVSKKKATLDLYDVINSFIPYLKVANRHGVHNDFEMLLTRQLDLIDFGHLNFESLQVSKDEFMALSEKFYNSTHGEIFGEELRTKLEQLKFAFKKVYS